MNFLFIFIYPELSLHLLAILNMEGTRIRGREEEERARAEDEKVLLTILHP